MAGTSWVAGTVQLYIMVLLQRLDLCDDAGRGRAGATATEEAQRRQAEDKEGDWGKRRCGWA
jgi:hypothetical protein